MEAVRLTEFAYQLRGGSNAGLILGPEGADAVLVDTGLDGDTGKKILRLVEGLGLRLSGIVVTHAHADHFGGAALLRERTGVPVYAPALEAAVIANPLLEPLYLFSGAAPIAELRNKFTLAEPCHVDTLLEAGSRVISGVLVEVIPAPGHSPNQMMIAGGGACFLGDACFAPVVLRKHGIPFYVDVRQAAGTLNRLTDMDGRYAAYVPGHGEATVAIGQWAGENAAQLAAVREAVALALAEADQLEEIIRLAAGRLEVVIPNPVVFCLIQTTVLACLSALQAEGRAGVSVTANRLTWHQ